MRDNFMAGVIAGSIIGVGAGLYAVSRMSPRQRKKFMKAGSKVMKNASSMMNMTNAMNMF